MHERVFCNVNVDKLHDALQCGVHNFCSSIFQSLETVGHCTPRGSGVASAHGIPVVIALLQQHLTHDFDLCCPRVAPSVRVVSCTYHHWLCPIASGGAIVNCLFLVDACTAFCSSGLPHIVYLIACTVPQGLS